MRTLEFNLLVKVSIVEDLNRDLVLAMVERLELRIRDGEVLLNVLVGQDAVVTNVATNLGHDHPVGDRDG